MILLPEKRSELVHDAALNSCERVFSCLCNTCHAEAVKVTTEQVIQRKQYGAFHGCGRRQTCADRDIPIQYNCLLYTSDAADEL